MPLFRSISRWRAGRRSFPEPWKALLRRDVPFYERLSEADRDRLHRRILHFFHDYRFEGCGGLQLTDEIRLTIAAHACLLLFGHDRGDFPDLTSILVYPYDFVAPVGSTADGYVSDAMELRSGESWDLGSVILSWKETRRDLLIAHSRGRAPQNSHFPPRNLLFHEFAHQLDTSFRLTEAIDPDTGQTFNDDPWVKTLAEAYIRLNDLMHDPGEYRQLAIRAAWRPGSRGADTSETDTDADEESIRTMAMPHPALDTYGAEHPAELFAVATESFFETPAELRAQFPDLFAKLREFYRMDPFTLRRL